MNRAVLWGLLTGEEQPTCPEREMNRRALLKEALEQLQRLDLWRSRLPIDSPQGREVVVAGRRLLNFASNDYLGLANHPRLVQALREGAERYGVGSGGSALVCGYLRPHKELEERLAEWTGAERVLLFSSGYHANLTVIATLAARGERVFEDRLNHASLLDGALLAGARLRRYPHLDLETAARLLDERTALVATDAVFSMDGDLAPLPRWAELTAEAGCWLLVDDAHGFGVLGEGRGSLAHFGLVPSGHIVLMATLGKALGTFGAFVAADREVVDYLLQKGRPYIYTTSLPPALASAALAALRLLQEERWRQERLHQLIVHFRHRAEGAGLPLLPSETAIQPVVVGSTARVVRIGSELRRRGFLVGVIRPPTVPKGTARLRISLTALHTERDIDRLLENLRELL